MHDFCSQREQNKFTQLPLYVKSLCLKITPLFCTGIHNLAEKQCYKRIVETVGEGVGTRGIKDQTRLNRDILPPAFAVFFIIW